MPLMVQCRRKVGEVVKKATPKLSKMRCFAYNAVTVAIAAQNHRITTHVNNVPVIVSNNP